MTDIPYTTPEEDPFNVRPVFLQPRRRRSSLLDKWIQEQQKTPDDGPSHNSRLGVTVLPNPSKDDVATLDNYDIVDDDDLPATPDVHENEVPATPTTTRSKRTSKLLQTPASFRSFKPFRSASPAASSNGHESPRSSRFSFLPRAPRHSTDASIVAARSASRQHNRSTSVSTLGLSVSGYSPCLSDAPNSNSSFRWRPSVLGHFASASTSQASVPSDTVYTPSRPSISSGDTYISGTATTDSEFPMTPSRLNFMDSIRFRTKSNGSVFTSASAIFSSGSLQSQKTGPSSSHLGNPPAAFDSVNTPMSTITQRSQKSRIPLALKPTSQLANTNISHNDEDDDDDDGTYHATKQPEKQTDPSRPHIAYSSGGTLSRVNLASLGTRHRKKKRLVVRGVGPHDVRKFEGIKQWCESFGEVSQIVRMPNGDLHVHFRLAEVADTVCRLRAKVYIAGVGSVQLSWLTGDKR